MGPQKGFLILSSTKKDKKRKLWKIPLIVICILSPIVAWLGFGEQGLIHLYHTEMERQAYNERIRQLTEENQALLDEIKLLRTDMKYVEDVARKHFNMIKENEVIYRFGKEEQHDNDAEASPIKARNGDNIGKPVREDLHDEPIK
jgi:cell division protein FtsB